ncbi:MAG: tRNA lysidine(34) synthetase TilS [Alphaproteobacteria bacterium]|nr:tRNA lysidine(34) synthetase TilS [Alphaproteobacteria bacterium]
MFITDIEFEGLMAPFLLKTSFAVAVSGGADSLALALLAKRYADTYGLQMTAITVDHGLRSNSADEAQWVHDLLTTKGVSHETCMWGHDAIPQTKIQERARNARYDLLGRWCQENNVSTLLTAHHQDDQIETFFMRLAHQSGLKGLSSMKAVRTMPFGKLVRPLLSISKTRLIETLEAFECEWCDDPSNANDTFERVRLRKALEGLYKQGLLAPDTIATSIKKLQTIDDFLDESVAMFFSTYALGRFSLKAFQAQHVVLQKRILVHVIRQLSLASYAPPDAAIDQVCQQLMKPGFKGATIAGLYFRRSAGSMVEVKQEVRKD